MSDRLTVLLAVKHLAERSGLSLHVHDVAVELHRLGHRPICYSPQNEEVARELRARTIPVANTLEAIAAQPDIIHGHNHDETLQALAYFPMVPAVQTCHGWTSARNAPYLHPRVRRYLPVDGTCRDRLRFQDGVADALIETHYNFVDMSRFVSREPLPDRPRRAFVFCRKRPPFLDLLREACAERNITIDVLGVAIDDPQTVLRDYDLVFARGRCALESMAVGAALVVCGREGLGGMVTTGNFDEFRELNFGIRAFRPVTRETIAQALDAYNAIDAMKVAARIRAEAGLDVTVRGLVETYRAVIREPLPDDRRAESQAIVRHLADVSRVIQLDTEQRIERVKSTAAARIKRLRTTFKRLRRLKRVEDERINVVVAELRMQVQQLQQTREGVQQTLEGERDLRRSLAADVERWRVKAEGLREELSALRTEHQRVRTEHNRLTKEAAARLPKFERLRVEVNELQKREQRLLGEADQLRNRVTELQSQKERLVKDRDELRAKDAARRVERPFSPLARVGRYLKARLAPRLSE